MDVPEVLTASMSHFTGRGWLLLHVLDWLETNSPFFVLAGPPGSGKSTCLAWLAGCGPEPADTLVADQLSEVRSRVTASYFASPSNLSPLSFATTMMDQLTKRVKGFGEALCETGFPGSISVVQNIGSNFGSVTGVVIQHYNFGGLSDREVFDRCFVQPLRRLNRGSQARPFLLLVDALDETMSYRESEGLPELISHCEELGKTVRFLVTTRHDPRIARLYGAATWRDLIKDAPPGSEEVREYADHRLASFPPETRDRLADGIARQAQGNFLYACLVIDEVVTRPDDEADAMSDLPKSLGDIYHRFLNREVGRDTKLWYAAYRPLLGLLAVARGNGLTRSQLDGILGAEIKKALGLDIDLCLTICRQYLTAPAPGGPFRLFHKSFTDFLLGEGNEHFRIAPDEMNAQMAHHYLDIWGGLDAGLPGLLDRSNRERDARYGLDHVAGHLMAAGEWPELGRLVMSFIPANGVLRQPWADSRLSAEGHYGGYLRDLGLVWERAEKNKDVGTAVSAALIASSISSQSIRLSPRLLVGLVTVGTTAGRWSPSAALEYARLYVEPEAKAEVAIGLLDPGMDLPWDQVVRFAVAIGSQLDSACARVLAAIARSVPPSQVPAVVVAIGDCLLESLRKEPLATLIDRIPELEAESRSVLLDEVRRLSAESRVQLLARLADRSTEPKRSALFREALEVVREMCRRERLDALDGLVVILPVELLDIAEELAKTAGEIEMVARTRLALIKRREKERRDSEARLVLEEVAAIPPFDVKCRTLLQIRDSLPEHLQDEADRELTTTLVAHPEEKKQFDLVCSAISLVGRSFIPSLLSAARDNMPEYLVDTLVTALAPRLKECPEVVCEVAWAVFELHVPDFYVVFWSRSIALLAPYLGHEGVRKAIRIAEEFPDRDLDIWPTELLPALAPFLPADLVPEAYGIIKRMIKGGRHDLDVILCLEAIIPVLPEDLLEEAMTDTEEFYWSGHHPRALAAFRSRLPNAEFNTALRRSIAASSKMDLELCNYLKNIAPLVTAETLAEVVRLDHPAVRHQDTTAIQILACSVPEFLLPDLLPHTKRLDDVLLQIDVLQTINSRCGDGVRQSVLSELSEAYTRFLSGITDKGGAWPGVKFFQDHANLLPKDQVMLAWQVAASPLAGLKSGAAMEALIHRLPNDNQPRGYGQIVAAVTQIHDEAVLNRLAVSLLESARDPSQSVAFYSLLLERFPRLDSDLIRSAVWKELLLFRPPLFDTDLLAAARSFVNPQLKCSALLDLIHHLSADPRESHYNECVTAVHTTLQEIPPKDRGFWLRLVVGEALLPDSLLDDVYAAAVATFAATDVSVPAFAVVHAVVDAEDWHYLMNTLGQRLSKPKQSKDEIYHEALRRLSGLTPELVRLAWFSVLVQFHPAAVQREGASLPRHQSLLLRCRDLFRRGGGVGGPCARPTIEFALGFLEPPRRMTALELIGKVLPADIRLRLSELVLRVVQPPKDALPLLGVLLPPLSTLGSTALRLGRYRIGRAMLALLRPADAELCRLWTWINRSKEPAKSLAYPAKGGAGKDMADPRRVFQMFAGSNLDYRTECYPRLVAELPPSDLPKLLHYFRQDFGSPMDKYQKKDVLVLFAERSPAATLRDVVRVALDILYDAYLSQAVLTVVVRRLTNDEKPECAAEAFQQAADDHHDHPHLAAVLTVLGQFLPEELLQKAIGLVPGYTMRWGEAWHYDPIDAYLALAVNRTGPTADLLYRKALRYIESASSGQSDLIGFDRLLPQLPPHLLPEALKLTRGHPDRSACTSGLIKMAQSKPASDLSSVLTTAVNVLRVPSDQQGLSAVLAALAERASGDVLLAALSTAVAIPDTDARARALGPLISSLVNWLSKGDSKVREAHTDACLAAVRQISKYGRPALLSSLREMLPWLIAVGANDTAAIVLDTLLTVARKWE